MNDDLKLINAKDLEDHIKSFAGLFTDDGFMVRLEAVLGAIDLMKPAVVRCKDCKWYDDKGKIKQCTIISWRAYCTTENGFCDMAKMKGGNDD